MSEYSLIVHVRRQTRSQLSGSARSIVMRPPSSIAFTLHCPSTALCRIFSSRYYTLPSFHCSITITMNFRDRELQFRVEGKNVKRLVLKDEVL